MKNIKIARQLLLPALLFFFSCNKNNTEKIKDDGGVLIQSKFNYNDFKKQVGDSVVIDFLNTKKDTFLYLGIPEVYYVTPLISSNHKNFGKMFTKINADSSISSLIAKTDSYNRLRGEGEITYMGVGVENYVVFKFSKSKIVSFAELSFVTSSKIKNNSLDENESSSCTGTCYKQAKDACDADPDCKMLCDNLKTCNGTIVVACLLHCLFK